MELYKDIFNSSVEGILVIEKDGKIVEANPACHQMFGYEEGRLKEENLDSLIPDSVRHKHHELTDSYFKNPHPRQMGAGLSLHGRRSDGTEFPIEVSLAYFEKEGVKMAIALVVDVTKRVNVEKKLRESEEKLIIYASQLEQKVKERTDELAKLVDRLEQTNTELEDEIKVRMKAERDAKMALEKEKELNELKSRFVSMASHEFRTPLSTIMSSASLVERYTSPETEEKRRKHINRIKNNVNDMVAILNDFLSLDKLEEGKIHFVPAELDFKELVSEILDELRSITKKNQKIILQYDRDEVHASVDRQIMKNILFNLVSNAIKYSGDNSEIKVKVQSVGEDIRIDVADQGHGIPESDQKHIFERFFRAHNVANIQGTGLGLNLVRRYVEIMGGTINFKSKEGEGSTFIVFLPANPDTDD